MVVLVEELIKTLSRCRSLLITWKPAGDQSSRVEAEMNHKSVANVLHGYKAFRFGDSLCCHHKNPSEEYFFSSPVIPVVKEINGFCGITFREQRGR